MSSILADDSFLVNQPTCGGEGGCGVSANEYSCAQGGAQINFGDLTPYITYGSSGSINAKKLNGGLYCGPVSIESGSKP